MSDDSRPRRVGVVSLGCPKNLVDTEIILGELRRRGYELVGELDDADTVIVNTCGFIDEAKQESIDAILDVASRKDHHLQRLLVAGCMVNRYGRELAEEIPEIDGFIGLDDLRQVDEVIQIGAGPSPPAPSHAVFDHTSPRILTTRGYAYLKVSEGCDNPCTFCAIPQWRGRYRSRTVDSLVQEVQQLERHGILELCLLAQDTTRYGEDLGYGRDGLQRLVETLLQETEIPWIRFLYAYPSTLDDGLLRLMGQEERFLSYLDIPLQHSHPEILSAMRRGGSVTTYERLIGRARELAPDVFVRTTFIVGFPGETEEHALHLRQFVERVRFDHLGAFVYSPEPDTPASLLSGRVPRTVARRRYRELLAHQEPFSLASRKALLGRRMRVLVEGVCAETEHLLEARHYGMAPEVDGRVLINDGVAPPGSFAWVEMTEAHPDDLVGRIVTSEEDSRVQSSAASRS